MHLTAVKRRALEYLTSSLPKQLHEKNVLSEFSFLQTFNTQQLSRRAPSIISSSTKLNHAGLIRCISHVPESHGGRWLKAVTQVTEMAHSTNSGHGLASDQAAGAGKYTVWCLPSSTASLGLYFCPRLSGPPCTQALRDHRSIQETLPGMGSSEIWQRPPQSLKWRSASKKALHRSS